MKLLRFLLSYIGISATTIAFHRALEVAKEVLKIFTDIKIILGGPHISSNVKHAMSYHEFDYGVLCEGELTIVELLDALNKNEPLSNVKGIAFRNEKNELIITPKREYNTNLDFLPFPAYELIKNIFLFTAFEL